MVNDIIKEYKNIEKSISSLQDKLKEVDPDNSLLNLVKIDWMGIHYTAEFGGRYYGKTVFDGFKNYIKDLETEIYNIKK